MAEIEYHYGRREPNRIEQERFNVEVRAFESGRALGDQKEYERRASDPIELVIDLATYGPRLARAALHGALGVPFRRIDDKS